MDTALPETILRIDLARPLEMIVGCDVTPEDAEALLAHGDAIPGFPCELREYVVLLVTYRSNAGTTWAAGSQLRVGVDLERVEVLALTRSGLVCVPAGPVG